jgi:hypothetical protein
MKLNDQEKRYLIYAALGVGAYFFVTKLLPGMVQKVAEAAGKTAGGAATGAVKGATTGASQVVTAAITAAPSAISQVVRGVNDWTLSSDNLLRPVGAAVGNMAYDLTHNKWVDVSNWKGTLFQ